MKAKIDTSPEAVFVGLRRISPDIAFSLYWGVNPEPVPLAMAREEFNRMLKEGYREHVVEASALTVFYGEVVEAKSYMSGFFYKPGEMDPDLDGFLPEILLRAVRDLAAKVDFPQAEAATQYLKEVKDAREHQRSER